MRVARALAAASMLGLCCTVPAGADSIPALAASAPVSTAAPAAAAVAGLAAAIEEARASEVDVLAPEGYLRATRVHAQALKEAQRGRDPQAVGLARDGHEALQRAIAAAGVARQSFGAIVKAREDALAAQAPQRAPQDWLRAAERFERAMKENESGDIANAQRRAAEAEVLLRDAELIAIKTGILGEARALIAQADEQKAERLAPSSMQSARRHLADAEQEIQRNRYDTGVSQRYAAQASYEARHATYLAQLIDRVMRQPRQEGGVEALILSWEEPLQRIAMEMELQLRFDEGLQPPLQELSEQVQQRAQERRRLRQELLDRDEQLAALNAQLRRLEARLGGVSEERIALQRRVDAQERLRLNVATIEASFTAEEARVYRQGEDVIVSLLGLRFPPGRSAIEGSAVALMAKLREALELFPQAAVSVEGHTDSSGSDSTNLLLSQDRADAVKQYLVTQFAFDPETISSIGYGEARPVATNETAAGRARNRRIDLVIHIDGVR